jgi:hypothetical protein
LCIAYRLILPERSLMKKMRSPTSCGLRNSLAESRDSILYFRVIRFSKDVVRIHWFKRLNYTANQKHIDRVDRGCASWIDAAVDCVYIFLLDQSRTPVENDHSNKQREQPDIVGGRLVVVKGICCGS